jgi:hypothetical protein
LTPERALVDKGDLNLLVPVAGEIDATIEMCFAKKSVTANLAYKLDEDLWNILEEACNSDGAWPPNDEIWAILTDLRFAAEKAVAGVKYYFNWPEIPENGLSAWMYEFSVNGERWKQVRPRHKYACVGGNFISLEPKSIVALQDYLRRDNPIFFALRHLHRAKLEYNPRYQWIDATIAAELAIKEFVIRKKPEFETLILETASPRLGKMYGSILKSMTGCESPKKKEIDKGAEKRNRLLHRPDEPDPDFQEALDYVDAVEIAIFHLLSLLYPDDWVFNHLYSKRIRVEIS